METKLDERELRSLVGRLRVFTLSEICRNLTGGKEERKTKVWVSKKLKKLIREGKLSFLKHNLKIGRIYFVRNVRKQEILERVNALLLIEYRKFLQGKKFSKPALIAAFLLKILREKGGCSLKDLMRETRKIRRRVKAYRQEIERALQFLEACGYVSREGDLVFFYTEKRAGIPGFSGRKKLKPLVRFYLVNDPKELPELIRKGEHIGLITQNPEVREVLMRVGKLVEVFVL